MTRFRWIYNEFGGGLLESAYAGSLVHACRKRRLRVQREVCVPFWFDRTIVANYRLDLVVENRLIVEVKAVATLLPEHIAQTMHYVRATDFELALFAQLWPPTGGSALYDSELSQETTSTKACNGKRRAGAGNHKRVLNRFFL